MSRLYSVVVAGTVCLWMASGAAGQQAGTAGQPVRVSVAVAAESTDNRDSTENDKQANVDVFLRPRLTLFMGDYNSFLDLYYTPILRYRTEPGENQDETTFHHALGINVNHGLSERVRMRANERLSISDDPAIDVNGSVVRGNHSYVLNAIDAGLNYDLFRYSNLDILLHNQIRRFDDAEVASLSDEDMSSVRLQHRRSLTIKLRTLLTAEYRMYGYEKNAGISRNFDSVIAAAGLENNFSENTIGSLSVGWQTRAYDDSAFDSEGKPYVNAELSGQLNEDYRIGALAGYGVRDSDAYPYPSQEYKDIRGFVDAKLTQKLLLRMSGTYRLSTYEPISLPVRGGGDETVIVADAELSFRVLETASLMVGYRIEDIQADDAVGASYVKNTARLGATLSF